MRLLYLIGIPGSGKTTLMEKALSGLPVLETPKQPVPHIVYPNGTQLGVLREGFGGTDGLAMNIQPKVLHWLETRPFENIVAEGDRLANNAFFAGAVYYGYDLTVAFLDCPSWLAQERRDARGSNQNPTWLKGRVSKVLNLAARWGSTRWLLNAERPVEELADVLRGHEAIRNLSR